MEGLEWHADKSDSQREEGVVAVNLVSCPTQAPKKQKLCPAKTRGVLFGVHSLISMALEGAPEFQQDGPPTHTCLRIACHSHAVGLR